MADGSNTTGTDALRLSPRLPDSRQEREQEDEVLAKGAAAFEGDERLLAVYRRAKELIQRYDLFLFKQTIHTADVTHLVICNTWRIEKVSDADLKLFMRDLVTGDWTPVADDILAAKEDGHLWPSFQLWPIWKQMSTTNMWRGICRLVLGKACDAAAQIEGYPIDQWRNPWLQSGFDGLRVWVLSHLESHYLGRPGKEKKRKLSMGQHVRKWEHGALHIASMQQAARALRAAFFEHVVDKELFSVALAIDYSEVSTNRYLKLAMHRQAVLRVARERRNLLPLLPYIDSKQWHRDDLFSRKLWVRGDRKKTVIDRSSKYLASFHSATAWRWLARAPVSIVSTWAQRTIRSESAFEYLALANVTAKIPVVAVRKYLAQMHGVLAQSNEADVLFIPRDPAVRVVRIYLQHAAQLWEKGGHAAVVEWLHGQNLESEAISIRDFLRGEGIEKGLPQKNSTWPSLLELSKDWHTRVRLEAMRQNEERARATTWDSALAECEVDGFTFSPLTSAWALAVEGYEMHHCVADYTEWCMTGHGRVFAVRGSDTQRATLELRLVKQHARWEVGQLFGVCNETDSVITDYPAMRRAADKFALRYQTALAGKPHKRVSAPITDVDEEV